MNDSQEIKDIQERMADCIRELRTMAPHVGSARQIKEFSGDQRKNALAVEQVKFIQRGESVAAAENLARSCPTYLERFRELEKIYSDACGVIAAWEAVMARFEACRSMLAMSRETLKTLEG